VLVALAIVGIGILTLLQLHTRGLWLSRAASETTSAVLVAQGKMGETLSSSSIAEAGEEDAGDGFLWQWTATPLEPTREGEITRLYEVRGRLTRPAVSGERAVELVSNKAVMVKP
jgi:hypothetical protein